MQNICLGLNSVCVGSESRFFNGHTNIEDNMFLVFGVKGVMELNKKFRCAIEFNILSYMTHQLLSIGNCVAALDELHLFLDSPKNQWRKLTGNQSDISPEGTAAGSEAL